MHANSIAILYVMETLLDTMDLRGCQLCVLGEAIKLGRDSTCWVHFLVTLVTKSSCLFDVLECLYEFVLSLLVRSLLRILYVLVSDKRESALSVKSCLSIITMATPLCAVSTTLDWSSLTCLMGLHSSMMS